MTRSWWLSAAAPVSEGLSGDAGVKLGPHGTIVVDDRYRCSVPGIYAIGDLIHGPMLAHKAMEEGVVFAEQLTGQSSEVEYQYVPASAILGRKRLR